MKKCRGRNGRVIIKNKIVKKLKRNLQELESFKSQGLGTLEMKSVTGGRVAADTNTAARTHTVYNGACAVLVFDYTLDCTNSNGVTEYYGQSNPRNP